MEKLRKLFVTIGVEAALVLGITKSMLSGIDGAYTESPVVITEPNIVQRTTENEVLVTRVLRVYDGDTFYCDIDGWPAIVGKNIGIRLAHIDTPEIKGTVGDTQKLAQKAKLVASGMLRSGKPIVLVNIKRGKYFRVIADVVVGGENLSELLFEEGLAQHYEGGTRPVWEE